MAASAGGGGGVAGAPRGGVSRTAPVTVGEVASARTVASGEGVELRELTARPEATDVLVVRWGRLDDDLARISAVAATATDPAPTTPIPSALIDLSCIARALASWANVSPKCARLQAPLATAFVLVKGARPARTPRARQAPAAFAQRAVSAVSAAHAYARAAAMLRRRVRRARERKGRVRPPEPTAPLKGARGTLALCRSLAARIAHL